MPLTVPAHQVLVLPFMRGRKSPLPGAALLLGTALPDLAFLVGGYRLNAISHLAYGPLLMSVTLGVLLYIWIEALFVPALATALPARGRWPLARLCTTRGLPDSLRGWAWTLAALILGSYTHLFFDGWTHATMWPARVLYPHARLEIAGLGGMGAAHGLQSCLSVVASLIVLSWTHRAMMAAPECSESPGWWRRLALLAAGVLGGAALGGAIGVAIFGWPETSRQLVFIVMSPLSLGGLFGATWAAWRLRDDDAACAAGPG